MYPIQPHHKNNEQLYHENIYFLSGQTKFQIFRIQMKFDSALGFSYQLCKEGKWLLLVDGTEIDEGFQKKNEHYLSRT